MIRSMSTRKPQGQGIGQRQGHGGYEQLIGKATVDNLLSDAKLIRSRTMPTNVFGESPVKFESEARTPVREEAIDKQVKKASKVHPIFTIFGRKKKATARPEFSRYMQYLKEGGIWDADASKPVIY